VSLPARVPKSAHDHDRAIAMADEIKNAQLKASADRAKLDQSVKDAQKPIPRTPEDEHEARLEELDRKVREDMKARGVR
jgi:hypothetical protein